MVMFLHDDCFNEISKDNVDGNNFYSHDVMFQFNAPGPSSCARKVQLSVKRSIQTALTGMSVSLLRTPIYLKYVNNFISVDNKICAGVARNPQRYLVPHPTDCTKFYSCQRNGWGGWIANVMDCPLTTGFDR